MADLRLVHEGDDTLGEKASANRNILATEVDIADSLFSTARGLMLRATLPDNYALVMEVGGGTLLPFSSGPPLQSVHMLFVRMALDVLWLDGDEVVRVSRMHPWRSIGIARADRIIELPAGNADGVSVGDSVILENRDSDTTDSE
ncbi:DUF192 domain-containing protein [Halovenus rubra]|uniref:DUF192 domain-containing protein n=2 Tax=Halovenus rubra TaxID=869890 RepID=A0ACC7E493_9EURY|nr:DUF192 domain-containing protein [Halovenus rubra]